MLCCSISPNILIHCSSALGFEPTVSSQYCGIWIHHHIISFHWCYPPSQVPSKLSVNNRQEVVSGLTPDPHQLSYHINVMVWSMQLDFCQVNTIYPKIRSLNKEIKQILWWTNESCKHHKKKFKFIMKHHSFKAFQKTNT